MSVTTVRVRTSSLLQLELLFRRIDRITFHKTNKSFYSDFVFVELDQKKKNFREKAKNSENV